MSARTYFFHRWKIARIRVTQTHAQQMVRSSLDLPHSKRMFRTAPVSSVVQLPKKIAGCFIVRDKE